MTLQEISPQLLNMLLMFVLFGLLMYFLMIRPAKKRAVEQENMRNSLGPGSRVMLQSGMFGTIKYLGEKQAVIELAPGLEVTVVKPAIMRSITADEEEFEYDDGTEPAASELTETSEPTDTPELTDTPDPVDTGVDADDPADPQVYEDAFKPEPAQAQEK